MPDDIAISFVLSRHDVGVFVMGLWVGGIIGWWLGLFVRSSGKGTDSSW
jgi:hypothetical protein